MVVWPGQKRPTRARQTVITICKPPAAFAIAICDMTKRTGFPKAHPLYSDPTVSQSACMLPGTRKRTSMQ